MYGYVCTYVCMHMRACVRVVLHPYLISYYTVHERGGQDRSSTFYYVTWYDFKSLCYSLSHSLSLSHTHTLSFSLYPTLSLSHTHTHTYIYRYIDIYIYIYIYEILCCIVILSSILCICCHSCSALFPRIMVRPEVRSEVSVKVKWRGSIRREATNNSNTFKKMKENAKWCLAFHWLRKRKARDANDQIESI